MTVNNFFELKAKDNKNNVISLSDFKDKVILVVNVASECGFTKQYAGLEELFQKYKDQGFVILGFPCNQFGGQEPGSNEDIADFCFRRNVTFPIMEKIDVNGDHEDPVYTYLKSQKKSLMMSRIKWNFEKFLIAKDGTVYDRYASTTTPEALDKDVEKLLKA
ncbi:hypothetical protein EDD11_004236 [Mortierella claussenii]|nr:hypothetical protein EDD11_004236 [Mortierella claussenii]